MITRMELLEMLRDGIADPAVAEHLREGRPRVMLATLDGTSDDCEMIVTLKTGSAMTTFMVSVRELASSKLPHRS